MGQALALKDKMVAEDEIAKLGRLLAENRAQKAEAMARMEKLKAD
jgi:hypothetical protein